MSMKEELQTLDYTLPYNQYVDPDVFQEERVKIFRQNWVMVGHISQVAQIGDFFTFEVAGEPIIVTRGNDEKIRAFYNICPHRGTKVEREKAGNKKILQCMYHGWTFQLDGKVHKAPNFKNTELGEYSCLTPISLEIHHSLIFVNLDTDASSMTETYQAFIAELEKYTFLPSLKKVRERERIVQANWKAVIDNYLECDHCPIAHPGFSKAFDLSNYNIIPSENYSCSYSNMKNGQEDAAARFYWVWPNLMISIYPGSGNLTTSQIVPIDENTSLAIYRYYFAHDNLTDEEEELIKFVDQVREEDFELVELLQSGFHSQAFEKGIYSPSENALQHFHQIYKQAMD